MIFGFMIRQETKFTHIRDNLSVFLKFKYTFVFEYFTLIKI